MSAPPAERMRSHHPRRKRSTSPTAALGLSPAAELQVILALKIQIGYQETALAEQLRVLNERAAELRDQEVG
jgi:hypothetical protein